MTLPRVSLLADAPEKRALHVEDARRFIEEHQGFTYAREGAEALVEAAVDSLALFPDCQARATLTGLAHYVLTRQK